MEKHRALRQGRSREGEDLLCTDAALGSAELLVVEELRRAQG